MALGLLALGAGALAPPYQPSWGGNTHGVTPFPQGDHPTEEMDLFVGEENGTPVLGMWLESTWIAYAYVTSADGSGPHVPIDAAEVERRLGGVPRKNPLGAWPDVLAPGTDAVDPTTWRTDPAFMGLIDTLAAGGTRRVVHWRNIAEVAGLVLGPLAMLVGAVPIVRSLWRGCVEARRAGAGLCPGCGYDLRGSVGAMCPECGRNEKARSPGPSSLKWRQGDSNP